jgi:Nucleotidyltransferase
MPASDDVSTRLADALRANEKLWECLRRVAALDLPAWYLGAGCVAQTIWNVAHGKAPSADILDYDLVYYDRDLSEARERSVQREARELVADLHIELDVTNEARVHLWYPRQFGYGIQPYQSTTQLERGRRRPRPSEFARAVVRLRCGHRWAPTISSTLWCARTASRSRPKSMTRRSLDG